MWRQSTLDESCSIAMTRSLLFRRAETTTARQIAVYALTTWPAPLAEEVEASRGPVYYSVP
eukprot:1186301-Pleurochrysis_carterae.AAC.2